MLDMDQMTSRKHPTKPGYILCQNWQAGAKVGVEYEMQWPPAPNPFVDRDLATVTDWQLVCDFNRAEEIAGVPKRLQNRIVRRTWELQDGYGVPGFVPVEGYDWSGIRDSSKEARAAIGRTIRAMLGRAGISSYRARTQD